MKLLQQQWQQKPIVVQEAFVSELQDWVCKAPHIPFPQKNVHSPITCGK